MERPGERRKLGAERAGRLRDLRATNIQENGEVTTCQAGQRETRQRKPSKIDAKMTVRPGSALLLGLLGGLAVGCVGVKPVPGRSDRQGIEAAISRYVAASNRGDADALTQLYAEDAVLLPPAHEPIEGREAIGAFWHQGTDEGLEVTTLKVEVNGDLGYLVGRYHLPATDEEPADSGKYVMCLKRQFDGSWKLTADIWNSSGDSTDDAEEEPRPRSSVS
jgi:uncharacterized protein (TIGR02246 family)